MPKPATPSSSKSPGDDRNLVRVDENYVAPSFEDRVRLIWEKNSTAVTTVLVAILLAIAAKGGWEYLSAQKEQDVERAYDAATNSTQLKTFVAAHPDHPLAGAAQLRIADEAYAEGRFTDAIAPYEQAAAVFKTGPCASRARLGLAMAKLQGGREADGEAALKALASNPDEVKAFRAEAAYHLASAAAANGKPEDVKTYSEQLLQIDATSPWAQRVMQLRAVTGGAPAANVSPQPTTQAPLIKLPTPGK